MEIKPLSDELSVSGQIATEDVPAIKASGYRAIICNRPDGETPGQPVYVDIAEAAAANGVEARYLPVISGACDFDDVASFAAALESLPHPVLAYCRSGTRCAVLWALSQAGERHPQEILTATARAGYDLSGLLPQMFEISRRR